MQLGEKHNSQEIISMEEYLSKRQAIREQEKKKNGRSGSAFHEKSPALIYAELYV